MPSHYETLGLAPQASQQEIKQAYRELAKKLHPDKNPDPKAAEQFREVSAAYETLVDPIKRERYDRGGQEGRSGHQDAVKVPCSLEELYVGCVKDVALEGHEACAACGGTGSASKAPSACPACNGTGHGIIQMGPMQMFGPCQKCRARGKFVAQGDECLACAASGVKKFRRQVSVEVPPGAHHGEHIQLHGENAVGLVVETEHPSFSRQGDVLITKAAVPLVDALCGGSFYIKHLDGRMIEVIFSQVLEGGDVCVVPGEGIPRGQGKLFVKISVAFPAAVGEEQRQLLRKALGGVSPNRPGLKSAPSVQYANPEVTKKSELERCRPQSPHSFQEAQHVTCAHQ